MKTDYKAPWFKEFWNLFPKEERLLEKEKAEKDKQQEIKQDKGDKQDNPAKTPHRDIEQLIQLTK